MDHPVRRPGQGWSLPETRPAGFTLIELLVTLVVVGVVLTFAALSVRDDGQAELIREEAARLAALMALARDEAVLRRTEIGWLPQTDGYRFLLRDEDRWESLDEDRLLRARTLPQGVELAVTVEGEPPASALGDKARKDALVPEAVLWSSGEVTPLRAEFHADPGGPWSEVTLDLAGNLAVNHHGRQR